MKQCTHLDHVELTNTKTHVCEECIKTSDPWVRIHGRWRRKAVPCCTQPAMPHRVEKQSNEVGRRKLPVSLILSISRLLFPLHCHAQPF